MARQLRTLGISSDSLALPEHRAKLEALATSGHLTVADCELRHARNRQQVATNGRTKYPNFCVSSILDEAQLFQKQSIAGARKQFAQVTRIVIQPFAFAAFVLDNENNSQLTIDNSW